MLALFFALGSGVTIVLSRSLNGCLSKHTDAYNGTFYNFLTGLITSALLLLIVSLFHAPLSFTFKTSNLYMYLGGLIGVANVMLLNIVVPKISPVLLTLISFITQLISSMILDACILQIFSLTKCLGCFLIIIGLIIYQINLPSLISLKKSNPLLHKRSEI